MGIRPKRHDTWLVVPNLWGVVVGRSGVMKTPAVQEALKPIRRLGQLAKVEYEKQVRAAAAAAMVATREPGEPDTPQPSDFCSSCGHQWVFRMRFDRNG